MLYLLQSYRMKGNKRSADQLTESGGKVKAPQRDLTRTTPGRKAAAARYRSKKSGCFNKQGGTANAFTGIRPGSNAGRMPFYMAKAPTPRQNKEEGKTK